jgi:hypothetical protein
LYLKVELYKLACQFEKAAGLLKYPQATFNEMRDWAFSVICSKVLTRIDGQLEKIRSPKPGKGDAKAIRKKILNLRLLHNELIKIIKNSGYSQDNAGNSALNRFKIDTDSLPYREPSAELSMAEERLLEVGIRIMFKTNVIIPYNDPELQQRSFSKDEYSGQYNGRDNSIVIDASHYDMINDVEYLKFYLDHTATTIRHELQHAIQRQIAVLKYLRGTDPNQRFKEFGMPPKKQRKYWDNYPSTEHGLMAAEFYPLLSDDLKKFRTIRSKIPYRYKKMFFYYWIGEISFANFRDPLISDFFRIRIDKIDAENSDKDLDKKDIDNIEQLAISDWHNLVSSSGLTKTDFFDRLRADNPEAWKKAVKEFSKELGVVP